MAKNNINKKLAIKPKKGLIDPSVTNQKNPLDLEGRMFTIGYEFYRQDLCEVNALDKSPLRKSIENFKKFGKCTNELELKRLGIEMTSIVNTGAYKGYYKGIADDAEVKEYDTGSAARSFFFIDPSRKIIQIIVHKNSHT